MLSMSQTQMITDLKDLTLINSGSELDIYACDATCKRRKLPQQVNGQIFSPAQMGR